jgi:hypothetical protein
MSADDDRYLWDKSGPADREVERLEKLLGRYRFDPREAPRFERAPRRTWRTWALAAAVVAALGAAAAWWSRDTRPSYIVEGVADVSRVRVGESFSTGSGDHALITIGSIGSVNVKPGSHVRVDDAGAEHHKLFLERGEVRASIFARPGLFQIGTPAGLSIDMGCVYELAVDGEGASSMHVLTGRIAFAAAGRSVLIPAGAECLATSALGPNVPVRTVASREFVDAVRRLELAPEPDEADLAIVRKSNTHDESVSIWHLFRLAPAEATRRAMLEILARINPLPEGVELSSLLTADDATLDRWREIVERDWR